VTIGVTMKTTPQNVIMMVVTAADAMSGHNIVLNASVRIPIQNVRTAQAQEDATGGRGGVGATDLGWNDGAKPHVNYVRLWAMDIFTARKLSFNRNLSLWRENHLQIVIKL